jgi:hypothetical protein
MGKSELPSDDIELLSDVAAAKIVHQKRSTLATWRATGKGPVFIKLGRRVFYSRADLDAWIATQRREPAKAIST